MRHQDRLQRGMVSPILRRVPSIPLPSLFPLPPPPQVSAPVTFNERTFHHLPPDIAAAVGNLPPFPILSRRQCGVRPFPVSYLFSFPYSLSC